MSSCLATCDQSVQNKFSGQNFGCTNPLFSILQVTACNKKWTGVAKSLQHCCNATSTHHNLVPFFPEQFSTKKSVYYFSYTTLSHITSSETFYNHCLFSSSATTLLGLYFYFCFEFALGATASLRQTLEIHDLDHTHSLVSFKCSLFSNQKMLLLTKNCLQYQK